MLADTIVVDKGMLQEWFYTDDVTGKIMKKTDEWLNVEVICDSEQFSQAKVLVRKDSKKQPFAT